jgi:hypothetical protein
LIVAAVLALLTGCAILLHLRVFAPLRALLVIAWVCLSVRELAAWTTTASRVRTLGIDGNGQVYGCDRNGRRFDLRLLAGSVVGARVAWLRLGFEDGRHYGELLRGDCDDPDWRRLQVFWAQSRWTTG